MVRNATDDENGEKTTAFSWWIGRKGQDVLRESVWNENSCGKECVVSTQNQQ